MNQALAAAARRVIETVSRRTYDTHRIFGEQLLSHLFCHELLTQNPEFKSRVWLDYRPWPEESGESIAYWIEGLEDQPPLAIEVHVDDPADKSLLESSEVWGNVVSDVLKIATAIGHRQLGRGYELLFGELKYDPRDKRVGQFPLTDVGEVRRVEADALLSHTVMDEGVFEELRHPREATPHAIDLQLLACETSHAIGCWLWAIDLPT